MVISGNKSGTSGSSFSSENVTVSLHSNRSSGDGKGSNSSSNSSFKKPLSDLTNRFEESDDAVSKLRPRNITPNLFSTSILDSVCPNPPNAGKKPSLKQTVGKKITKYVFGKSDTSGLNKHAGKTKEQMNLAMVRTNPSKEAQIWKPSSSQFKYKCGAVALPEQDKSSPSFRKQSLFGKSKPYGVPEPKKKAEMLADSQLSDRTPQLTGLQKKILEKVMGRSISKKKNVLISSINKDGDSRPLSMVIRNEEELIKQNKKYGEQLQKQEDLLREKDSEVETFRRAGMMLKRLCLNQNEELKALKSALPEAIRETLRLRDLCQKQERELRETKTIIPSLQEQVAVLTQQLNNLSEGIEQVRLDRMAMSSRRSSRSTTSSESPESWKNIQVNANGSSGKSSMTIQSSTKSSKYNSPTGSQGKEISESPVNSLLTVDHLEVILRKLNMTAEQELASLEERCAKAFHDLGFSSSKRLDTTLLDMERPLPARLIE